MLAKRQNEISVVIPVFGCCECLETLCERLHSSLAEVVNSWEIVLVNDASPDNSWKIIERLAIKDKRIRGINLSRNYGQHYAITAGLDYCRGNWVVVMDCDLQDKPEMIPRLYNKAIQGWDIVVGLRLERKDSLVKKTVSRMFYKVFNYLTDGNYNHRVANYGIYSRQVIDNVCTLKERNRMFCLLVNWLGFDKTEIEIEHGKREFGKTAYSIEKMLNLAMDNIISHSNKPLKISIKLGFVMSLSSILFGLWLIIKFYMWGIPVTGWTSLMVSIFFSTGLIVGVIGMASLYIGKTFDEVKNRPLYIVKATTFSDCGGNN